jgi:hypothetical protein
MTAPVSSKSMIFPCASYEPTITSATTEP